jgi:RNA recognition motif-containing protein
MEAGRLKMTSDGKKKQEHQFRVFIGNLASETGSAGLWEYMRQWGRVLDAEVLIDPSTGKSRMYGFCSFADEEGARNCIEQEPHFLDGRNIVIRKYTATAF